MQDLFELTPELLLEQGQQMSNLYAAYENLFAGVAGDLEAINGGWSDLLANNFSGKIVAAQKSFAGALNMLRNSSDSVRAVAEASREMDAAWASKFGAAFSEKNRAITEHVPENGLLSEGPSFDVSDYCDKVTDTEYAALCMLWQKSAEQARAQKADHLTLFMQALKDTDYLPESDPLKHLTADQMIVTDSISGFSALTILDGDTAIVVFAGTDVKDIPDLIADAKIGLGEASVQSLQANALVGMLSEKCSNVVVTGHSLGGYLATSAALNNGKVSKCVAFDAPGRKDALLQNALNHSQASKVINYNAKGSGISWVHSHVGEVADPLEVEPNFLNHGIKQICDEMGGKEAIAKSWK